MNFSGENLLGQPVYSSQVPEKALPFNQLRDRVLQLPLVQKYSLDDGRLEALRVEFTSDNLENILEYATAMLQTSTDFELVLELFQIWHSTGKLDGVGLMFYGNLCQFAFKDYVKAKFLYEASSKFDPKNPITWRLLSSLLYREFHDEFTYNQILGKYRNITCENHIQYVPVLLRFLLNFIKDDTKAAYTSAVIVKKYIKNKDVAKLLYLQSIQIDKNNALSHFNVGLIYDNQERWIFAKHHYRECLRVDGSKHDAWFNLGGVIQESDHDTDTSLLMFKKAIAVNPNEALYCATIAETYHYWVNPSNLEEAEKYYLQAISLQDDHRSRANIAKLYAEKNEFLKALEHILAALAFETAESEEINGDFTFLQKIIPKIENEKVKDEWSRNLDKYKSLSKNFASTLRMKQSQLLRQVTLINEASNLVKIDTWLSLPPCLRNVLPAHNPSLHEKLFNMTSEHFTSIFPLLELALLDVGANLVLDYITGDWQVLKHTSV